MRTLLRLLVIWAALTVGLTLLGALELGKSFHLDARFTAGFLLIYWTGYFLGWHDKKRGSLPRTITTREELDALPSCSVVLDSEGEPNILHDNGWVLPNGPGGYTSWAVAQTLPATVLWEPEA